MSRKAQFLALLGCAALALVACAPAPTSSANTMPAEAAPVDAPISQAATNVMTAAIKVQGMDCGGCANTTREVVASLPGFKDFEADVAGQQVKVTFEKDTTPVEEIVTAINKNTDYKASAL